MQSSTSALYHAELQAFIQVHAELMRILHVLRDVEPQAFIAAGVIRNSIWAHLHEQAYLLHQTEIDVVYFDVQDDGTGEQKIREQLEARFPQMVWDVVNQARVHHWYRLEHGGCIAPYCSLTEALAAWPETATAVAVQLDAHGQCQIVAPFGLQDLFELNLRWNPAMVSYAVFQQRFESKAFLSTWPKLKMISAEPGI